MKQAMNHDRGRRRYTAKLKAQVVLEVLAGDKKPGQIAKAYSVHPNSVGLGSADASAFEVWISVGEYAQGPPQITHGTSAEDYVCLANINKPHAR